jgi:hypothetical protein
MARTEGTEPEWRKSSSCVSGECVELGTSQGHVLIRDSADTTGPVLTFTTGQWCRFLCEMPPRIATAPKPHEAESLYSA